MSAAAERLGELLKAGDELASACSTGRGDLPGLAEKWTRLRGEAHHEGHLLLDELAVIVRRVKDVTGS